MTIYNGRLTGDDGTMVEATIQLIQVGDVAPASALITPQNGTTFPASGGSLGFILEAFAADGQPVPASFVLDPITDPAFHGTVSGDLLRVDADPNQSSQGRSLTIRIQAS